MVNETLVRPAGFWESLLHPKRAKARQEAALEQAERSLEQMQLRRYIRDAKNNIERLENLLKPERRGEWTEQLAYWQAHLDSLETDGVHAIPKGQE